MAKPDFIPAFVTLDGHEQVQDQPTPDVATAIDQLVEAIQAHAQACLRRLQAAEKCAVARLEQFVPGERLLNKKEASAYLGIKQRTLDTFIANKTLPSIKLGNKCVRFRLSDLDEELARYTTKRREVRL